MSSLAPISRHENSLILRPKPVKPSTQEPSPIEVKGTLGPPHQFRRWAAPRDIGYVFRLYRPVVELTLDLKETYAKKRGSRSAGWKVPRWTVIGKLGNGTFGTVYSLYDRVLKQRVAAKVTRVPCEYECFLAWRNIPYVAHFYGRGFVPCFGTTAIMMEEVFPTLGSVLCVRQKLPFSEVMLICVQLLKAIRASTAKGLAHGDLGCRNLAYIREERIALYDLGSSHYPFFFQHAPNEITALEDRAPEIILGRKYDTTIDIWGIGCIIYHTYFGRQFVKIEKDNLKGQASALNQIFEGIGCPSEDYLEACRLWCVYSVLVKQKRDESLPPLLPIRIQREAANRELSSEITELFVKLLGGLLAYDVNRLCPEDALALCNQIAEQMKEAPNSDSSARKK